MIKNLLRVPFDADAHNELGKLYLAQGQRANAANRIEIALRLNPQNGEVRENLRLANEKPD